MYLIDGGILPPDPLSAVFTSFTHSASALFATVGYRLLITLNNTTYLDGLTKAIQDLKELYSDNQPIKPVKEENTVNRDNSVEDKPKMEDENISLSELVEANNLPH